MAYLYLHFAMGMQSTAEVFGTSQRKSMIWGAKMRWKSKLSSSSSSLLNWLLPIWSIYTSSWNMIILFGIHKWSGYMQFFWFKKNTRHTKLGQIFLSMYHIMISLMTIVQGVSIRQVVCFFFQSRQLHVYVRKKKIVFATRSTEILSM